MIVTGDTSQIDLPVKQSSGLKEAVRILNQVKGIGMVELSSRDVVRHKLVRDIVEAYGSNE
jgi:phosphate starvation-inducible PhoH-like protein